MKHVVKFMNDIAKLMEENDNLKKQINEDRKRYNDANLNIHREYERIRRTHNRHLRSSDTVILLQAARIEQLELKILKLEGAEK